MTRATFAGLTLVFSVLYGMGAAAAHDPVHWYPARWDFNNTGQIEYRFVDNVPIGDGTRSRVQDGAQEWNSLFQSIYFTYDYTQPDYEALYWGDSCSPDVGQNKIGWGSLPPGFLGAVKWCTYDSPSYPYSLKNFKMKIDDRGDDWYKGTGAVPHGKWDLWALSTHEFGHITGRGDNTTGWPYELHGDQAGHFNAGSDTYCDLQSPSTYHTMCPDQFAGYSFKRTLEEHEIDAFTTQY